MHPTTKSGKITTNQSTQILSAVSKKVSESIKRGREDEIKNKRKKTARSVEENELVDHPL